MNFDDVIRNRRSIRKYRPDPVTDEQIAELIGAARLAPSALNIQPWRFIAIRDAQTRKQLAGASASAFLANAPLILLSCMDFAAMGTTSERLRELYDVNAIGKDVYEGFASGALMPKEMDMHWMRTFLYHNAAIATENILLKATDMGLGSCWVGHFDQAEVRRIAGLDERYGVLALLAVGHADQQPAPRPRLPLEEILLKVI